MKFIFLLRLQTDQTTTCKLKEGKGAFNLNEEQMSVRVENHQSEAKNQIPFYFTKRYLWVASLLNACPKSRAIFIFFQNSRKLKRTADTHFSATLFPKTQGCLGSPRALRKNPVHFSSF